MMKFHCFKLDEYLSDSLCYKQTDQNLCVIYIVFFKVFPESKWSFFKRKLKPGTTFENPTYSEVRGIEHIT